MGGRKKTMNEEKNTEREQLIKKIKRLAREARNAYSAEKYERALEKAERGEKLIERFQGEVPKELERAHIDLLFAKAYATYDLVTQKYFWYGYLYPFLELGLGVAYFLKLNLSLTNVLTIVLMLVSAAGVFNASHTFSSTTDDYWITHETEVKLNVVSTATEEYRLPW